MLKSFALRNFQSFREQSRLSLSVSRRVPEDGLSCVSPAGSHLSRCLAVIGANASGKTGLIRSIAFVDWFIKHSFQHPAGDPVPLSPHFSSEEPCAFEIEFEMDARDWRYCLAVTRQRVVHESLYQRRSSSFSYVFKRDWSEERKAYVIRQQRFGLLQEEAEKVRENASLISTAAQYNVPVAQRILATPVHGNLFSIGRRGIDQDSLLQASKFYAENPDLLGKMSDILNAWDLGLSGIRVEKRQFPSKTGETKTFHLPFGVHRIGGREHVLAFYEESSGTQGAFILLANILPALRDGGIVIIDELEADLHPHMLVPLLDLFFSPQTNPRNAQIIFTCQAMEVLNLLNKAQVVLVEKNERCESSAWRLDSMKGIRSDDNLYAKYMAGAYGAVPRL